MSLSWLFNNLVAAVLLPPLNGLLLLALAGLCWRRRPRLGQALAGSGFVLLWLLSTPAVGDALLRTLEGEPVDALALDQAQAIVVLGGGRYRAAPEYGGDTVHSATLVRLRYAARLQRQTGLPLLVTGGRPDGGGTTEGRAMSDALMQDFGVPVRWVEEASDNTRENARLSAEILRREGITRVLLVTHAWHMPRALRSFTEAGLHALPAPTRFHREPLRPVDWLPTRYEESRWALHEWIGMAWYRLRG
jgi:uncharacterized SAM-binding protein YcdF (DUF218 family)